MLGVINYNSVNDKTQSLINEYRKAFQLTDKDNVNIFVLPKGKSAKKAGSFIDKPLSAKANRLNAEHTTCKNKIRELEMAISDTPSDDKSRKLMHLRQSLKYISNALAAEIASLPRTGYIVIEEDSEE